MASALTALAAPGLARADTVRLDGAPLDVFADGIGGLQVRFNGQPTAEFCCTPDETDGNGFAVRGVDSVSTRGSGLTPTQAPVLAAPSPGTQTLTSGYDVATINSDRLQDLSLHVVETVTYVNGSRDVAVRYVIRNTDQRPATFTVGALADLFVGGDDSGVGIFGSGPPQFVGGSDHAGGADGLVEVAGSPWSHYEENSYDQLFDDFAQGPLTDTILDEDTDNEVGVEWAAGELAPQATKTIDLIWRFNANPRVPPPPVIASGGAVGGSTVSLSGTAAPGSAITVLDGSVPVADTSAPDGEWAVTLTNVEPGTHHYTAVATDGLGRSSSASTPVDVTVAAQQQATPTPTPTPTPTVTPVPPPVVGKKVNAATKSGKVLIKVPGSNRFIELGPEAQIPVGTQVDTTKGRITLTTATGQAGVTQHADFYQGVFKVAQTKGKHPLTTLRLSGARPTCATAKGAHASATPKKKKKVKTRKLWGSGSGAFQTRGQYSSATVRGTTWLTQDSCAGTLTKVTSGVVSVRDVRRHRNVLVRKGHSYLARAPRR